MAEKMVASTAGKTAERMALLTAEMKAEMWDRSTAVLLVASKVASMAETMARSTAAR